MQRYPVVSERPKCCGLFVNDTTCRSCEFLSKCRKLFERFQKQKTVSEWLSEMKTETPEITTPAAVRFLCEEFEAVGGKAYRIPYSKAWATVVKEVIESCEENKIDPRLYIRAQVETLGKWTVKTGKVFYPNMLRGNNASSRFEEWLEKNGRKYGDHHRLKERTESLDLPAEMFFVETFFCCKDTASVVARKVRKRHKDWSLRIGRQKPILRLHAFHDFLMSVNTCLPYQFCLSSPVLYWGKVRKDFNAYMLVEKGVG